LKWQTLLAGMVDMFWRPREFYSWIVI